MTLLERPTPSTPLPALPTPSVSSGFTLPVRPPHRKRWTATEYDRLTDLGAFDGQKLELVNGEIYEKSPMGEPHRLSTVAATYVLMRLFTIDRFTVMPQVPFRLTPESEPEPDVAVYAGTLGENKSKDCHPLLAVEVSETTLGFDRNVKLPAYAAQKLPEVWIVNIPEQVVEVYRNPHEVVGGAWTYDRPLLFKGAEPFASLIDPAATLTAAELLGPQ